MRNQDQQELKAASCESYYHGRYQRYSTRTAPMRQIDIYIYTIFFVVAENI